MSNLAYCGHCGHEHECSASEPKIGIVTTNAIGDLVVTYNTFPTDGTVDK